MSRRAAGLRSCSRRATARALRVALLGALLTVPSSVFGQRQPQGNSGEAKPTVPQDSPARTEILTYDNWTVTCREGQSKEKRECAAEFSLVQQANGVRRVVLTWGVGYNKTGALVSVIRFPSGVQIPPGVVLRIPDKSSRKLPITVCEPTQCTAAAAMDDAFVQEVLVAPQVEAVVRSSDGREVTFKLEMKGFPQALAIVRK